MNEKNDKFGKMKTFVDSLEMNEVEMNEQAFLLKESDSDMLGGSGVNSGCYNWFNCSGAANSDGCVNFGVC